MLLIFEQPWSKSAILRFIEFDAVLNETHVLSSEVTEHPVESGQSLSDYVRTGPSRLSLEAFITNTPIRSNQQGLLTGEQAVFPLRGESLPYSLSATTRNQTRPAQVNGGIASPYQPPGFRIAPSPVSVTPAIWTNTQSSVGGNSLQFPNRVDRVKNVHEALRWLQDTGTPIRVISDLHTYPTMVISSMSAPKEATDSVTVTIDLVSVNYAETRTVTAFRTVTAPKTDIKAAETPVKKGTGTNPYDIPTTDPDRPATWAAFVSKWLAE